MNILFDKFKSKIPGYNPEFKDTLFTKFTDYGSSSEKKRSIHGKLYENAYELYTFAFFLGLYNNDFILLLLNIIKNIIRNFLLFLSLFNLP